MASFFSFLTHKRIPSRSTLRALLHGPLTAYRAIAYGFFLSILAVIFILIVAIHDSFLVTVPARGGSLTEGVIGAPRTINPVLAVTDTDVALARLVYAGLMKQGVDGELVPELADTYTLSPDSRTYTVTLKDAKFHDGKPVTSSDVAFTVSKLQNSALNPTHTEYWSDVGVETPDAQTVVFTLPAPRIDFIEHLTIGILPEHVWTDVPDDAFATAAENIHPIGAGPFQLTRIQSDDGVARTITLKRFSRYVLGTPLLKSLFIRVFDNQSELLSAAEDDDIDITAELWPSTLAAAELPSDMKAIAVPSTDEATLYHLRGDNGTLANAAFVTVLSQYVDKDQIIDIVEHGYGTPLNMTAAPVYTAEEALAKLSTLGYRQNNGTLLRGGSPVGFSIATTNDPDTVALATALANQFRALGITVSIRNFDPGTFQSELARDSFSAILTKRIDPPENYEAVIPLYRTNIPFVTKSDARGIIPSVLISPSLRYAEAASWYTNTDRLYRWFTNKAPVEQ